MVTSLARVRWGEISRPGRRARACLAPAAAGRQDGGELLADGADAVAHGGLDRSAGIQAGVAVGLE